MTWAHRSVVPPGPQGAGYILWLLVKLFVIESCGRKVVWTSHECVTTTSRRDSPRNLRCCDSRLQSPSATERATSGIERLIAAMRYRQWNAFCVVLSDRLARGPPPMRSAGLFAYTMVNQSSDQR